MRIGSVDGNERRAAFKEARQELKRLEGMKKGRSKIELW